jgi:hypothetical protein
MARLDIRLIGAATRALLGDPTTLTAQAAGADGWSRTDHLLAMVVDELRVANWQRSKDGARNRNKPKRISPLAKMPGHRYGRTDCSPDEVIAYLRRLNPRPLELEEVTHG